ncbi:MAG: tRNA (adenosine(37)-N6)-threonylcarbamoyltransferase complex ATPase subunit type 1 TsaE [Nocardioidaceae bacterium]
MSDLRVEEASVEDAPAVCRVIHAAFGNRPRLDPASSALSETPETVGDAIATDGGLLCRVDGEPAGALLFSDLGRSQGLRRVGAVPHFQARGVASALVGVAEEIGAARGYDGVEVIARLELPATIRFWERRGYVEVARLDTRITMGKELPAELLATTVDDTRAAGERLAAILRRGDVVLLTGELGAGKTTLTQGLGAGLKVRGDVTSPTFVISRVHPSLDHGPVLLHVDAYRLGDAAELDDLDLDAYVGEAVTVVEWGEGIADALSPDRLHVHLARERGLLGAGESEDRRVITVSAVGSRWYGTGLRSTMLGQDGR